MMARLVNLLWLLALTALTGTARAYSSKSVEIVELEVPESPQSGEDVRLTCRFRLNGQGHRLYTVNWWRGKDQFFSYKDSTHSTMSAYNFPGISVSRDDSSKDSVLLKNVSLDTSGIFKCEVMGEGPAFRTAVKTKVMNVIVPPREVLVNTYSGLDPHYYQAGDTISLNCTAKGAKPPAELSWEINDDSNLPLQTVRYNDHEDSRGLVTTAMGVTWTAPHHFIANEARVKCVAEVGRHRFYGDKKLYLDPASSAAFNHQIASTGCQRVSIVWSFLSLASLFLLRCCV